MKIHAQPGRPPTPAMFSIAEARRPPGAQASARGVDGEMAALTERAGDGRGREEERDTRAELGALIPAAVEGSESVV
jgi:hypothetical protein